MVGGGRVPILPPLGFVFWGYLAVSTRVRNLLHVGFALGVAAICLSSTGCVRRRLTVRSFPPGAQVFVDDQEVGTTPVSTSFVYYGTRKVTLIKDGYRTETLFQKINPPWYQIPPLDFVSENLLNLGGGYVVNFR